eukprot:114763_1
MNPLKLSNKHWNVKAIRRQQRTSSTESLQSFDHTIKLINGYCRTLVSCKSIPCRSGDQKLFTLKPNLHYNFDVFGTNDIINDVITIEIVKQLESNIKCKPIKSPNKLNDTQYNIHHLLESLQNKLRNTTNLCRKLDNKNKQLQIQNDKLQSKLDLIFNDKRELIDQREDLLKKQKLEIEELDLKYNIELKKRELEFTKQILFLTNSNKELNN